MRNERRTPGPRQGWQIALFLAILGFSFFGVVDAYRAVERFLVADTRATVRLWADAFLSMTDTMQRTLVGAQFDNARLEYIRSLATAGKVYKYRIYDANLRVVHAWTDRRFTVADSLSQHDGDVGAAARSGTDLIDIMRGRSDVHAPEVFAKAVVPYFRGGRLHGILTLYVDQTLPWKMARAEMARLIALFGPIALFALLHTLYTGRLLWRQRRDAAQIAHLAHHDPLTGTFKRSFFQEELDRALGPAGGAAGNCVLHLIDVDNFKLINDTLGHDVGDLVLKAVASRIVACVAVADVVCRFAGDEFAVVSTGLDADGAKRLAGRLVEEIRRIRDVAGIPVNLTISVGVAAAPADAMTPVELQKCADIALYRAKSQGRDTFVVYESGMETELIARTVLRRRIRKAVDTGGFEVQFQPLHDAESGRVAGFECLLRLRDDTGAYVPPSTFIPVAEDMGLTRPIGRFVLNEACRTAMEWPDDVTIAVNLSPRQFEFDIVGDVTAALAASGLPPHRLELEITETLLLAETDTVETALHALKDMGVRIVMDDFGTGYSSLSYLWKFPFDKLKVDRSCFTSLGKTEGVAEILRTITAMSGAMRLRVVAEGIETDEQREFARDAGYDELQGFLYSRPLDPGDVAAYIAEWADGTRGPRLYGKLRLAVSN